MEPLQAAGCSADVAWRQPDRGWCRRARLTDQPLFASLSCCIYALHLAFLTTPLLPLLPYASSPAPQAGTGYTLQLDTAYLYASDALPFQAAAEEDRSAPFPCSGRGCEERPAAAAAATPSTKLVLVPLYGMEEAAQAAAGGGRVTAQGANASAAAAGTFILRLKVGGGGAQCLGA